MGVAKIATGGRATSTTRVRRKAERRGGFTSATRLRVPMTGLDRGRTLLPRLHAMNVTIASVALPRVTYANSTKAKEYDAYVMGRLDILSGG